MASMVNLTLASLLVPAAAGAQELSADVVFSPDRAGAPASVRATFTVRGVDRPPDSVAVFTPAGLRLDPRAVRVRCSDADARRDTCPAASRIGSGEVAAQTVFGPFTADGAAYLGVARAGEHAAVWLTLEGFSRPLRAVVRRADGGYVVRLDGLADGAPEVPPGTISEISGSVRLDARRRTVTRTRRVRGRKRKVRTTHHLLRTPRTCPAEGWAGRIEVTTDGATRTVGYAARCRA